MSKYKILIKGYAREEGSEIVASPTTVLVYERSLKFIVDPGVSKQALIQALASENLKPGDIDFIFLTHYHPDHVFNIRLFPDTDIYDGDTIYRDDRESFYKGKIPNTTIDVIDTPGHAHEHASLLLHTEQGEVAIAGDVFWWMDEEEQRTDRKSLIEHGDPYAKDMKALKKSRAKLLEVADYIVPGHGKMFKVLQDK